MNSKGLGILQQIVPRYDDQAELLTLAFPDGATLSQHIHLNGALEAQFWSASVHVRVVEGPWSEAISDFAGRDLRLVPGPGPATDRMRSGAANLLGTGSLRAMARVLGVAGRRWPSLPDELRRRWLGASTRRTSGSVVAFESDGRSSCRRGTSAAAR